MVLEPVAWTPRRVMQLCSASMTTPTPFGSKWAPAARRSERRRHRLRLVKRVLGPFGSWWLKPRLEGTVPVRLGEQITHVRRQDTGLMVTTRDLEGQTHTVTAEHVLAATGYQVRLDGLDFLAPELRAGLARTGGSPISTRGSSPPCPACTSPASKRRRPSGRCSGSSAGRRSPHPASRQPSRAPDGAIATGDARTPCRSSSVSCGAGGDAAARPGVRRAGADRPGELGVLSRGADTARRNWWCWSAEPADRAPPTHRARAGPLYFPRPRRPAR